MPATRRRHFEPVSDFVSRSLCNWGPRDNAAAFVSARGRGRRRTARKDGEEKAARAAYIYVLIYLYLGILNPVKRIVNTSLARSSGLERILEIPRARVAERGMGRERGNERDSRRGIDRRTPGIVVL